MRVHVLDDWEGVALEFADWSPVTDAHEVTIHTSPLSDAEFQRELADANVLVLQRERTRLDRSLIEALPALELIVTTGAKNAAIDLQACADRGITVCGTGAGSGPVVEHAWALLLAGMRKVAAGDRGMRAGGWPPLVGSEVAGSRLGLLGLGRTGARMARIAQAFDMQVAAWSPNLTSESAAEHGVEYMPKADLFAWADVVSIHLVLGERSRHLVAEPELEALGPNGYLVNTSRGPIVDERALVAALTKRTIKGAMLDVFDAEPLPNDHPLRSFENVVLTPHLGYVTDRNLRAWFVDVVEDLAAYSAGHPIRVITAG